MSIKKSLVALAAAALASMAFASSALASGGTVVDADAGGVAMKIGEKIHYEGWAKFDGLPGSYECHVTAETEAIGDAKGNGDTLAKVTKFTVPDTDECTGTGTFSGCKLATHELEPTPVPLVTATKTDFDVSETKIKNTFTGCSVTNVTLTFANNALTLKPLATGTRAITGGTNALLGTTSAVGAKIAGVEISGTGNAHSEQHIIFVPTTSNNNVTASGELEITNGTPAGNDRCTWKLVEAV